jgi:hypothetical protein
VIFRCFCVKISWNSGRRQKGVLYEPRLGRDAGASRVPFRAILVLRRLTRLGVPVMKLPHKLGDEAAGGAKNVSQKKGRLLLSR